MGAADLRGEARGGALRADADHEAAALGHLEVVAQRGWRAHHQRLPLDPAGLDGRDQRLVVRRDIALVLGRRRPLDHADRVDRGGDVLPADDGRPAEAELHVVLTRAQPLGRHAHVVAAELRALLQHHRVDRLAVDVGLHPVRADRLDLHAQRDLARLAEREEEPAVLARVGVRDVAVGPVRAPARAPAPDRVLVPSGRAEVEEEAVVIHVGEVADLQEVLLHRQARRLGRPLWGRTLRADLFVRALRVAAASCEQPEPQNNRQQLPSHPSSYTRGPGVRPAGTVVDH